MFDKPSRRPAVGSRPGCRDHHRAMNDLLSARFQRPTFRGWRVAKQSPVTELEAALGRFGRYLISFCTTPGAVDEAGEHPCIHPIHPFILFDPAPLSSSPLSLILLCSSVPDSFFLLTCLSVYLPPFLRLQFWLRFRFYHSLITSLFPPCCYNTTPVARANRESTKSSSVIYFRLFYSRPSIAPRRGLENSIPSTDRPSSISRPRVDLLEPEPTSHAGLINHFHRSDNTFFRLCSLAS